VRGAAVIVVSYGSSELLEANLVPLSSAMPELSVIVVDCFTTSGERERVRELSDAHGWLALLLDENLGFGGGVNRGVDLAISGGADVFVVLNPDATLARSSADRLIGAARSDRRVLVAPVISRPDGSVWSAGMDVYLDDGSLAGWRFRARHGERRRRSWVSGACFAMSVELWRESGGFDEDYFLYWEDVDLSFRVERAGGRLAVDQEATAVHDEGGTQEALKPGRARSEIFYYYNIRNRLLYAERTLEPAQRRAWRRSALRVGFGTLRGAGRRQLLTSLAPWRALYRGVRDGLRGVRGA
jgi:GT2 family glycosyltransferase